MKYYTLAPPPALAPYVRSFWVFEHDAHARDPYIYRSLADGCAELIFHYKGAFTELGDKPITQARAMVHAQSRQFRRFITNESFGIFGVYIYPYAIPRLFNLPASALSNHMPDLQTLWKQEGRDIEEQMMLARNNQDRADLITAFLTGRLTRSRASEAPIDLAVRRLVHAKGAAPVSQLAGDYSLSTRQFERKFKEYSGFSPKLFSRIIRFQEAIKAYSSRKDMLLTDIAYSCGYYDQSHFIHDFREFSGYHPRQYFHQQAEGAEVQSGAPVNA